MRMTIPLSVSAYLLRLTSSTAFCLKVPKGRKLQRWGQQRLYASSVAVTSGVSRLSTLQTLLSHHGVPGSSGCGQPNGDLVPMAAPSLSGDDGDGGDDAPELVGSLLKSLPATTVVDNLHPYLVPLARSQTSGHLVCAYRPLVLGDDAETKSTPWPIVETKEGAPGMQLLALNSEHLMRRIVCEMDDNEDDDDSSDTYIDLYNKGLGQGLLGAENTALDTPYQKGSVAQLGYGVDKYVLLRVGPFPDLYTQMSREHLEKRGDEQSALIAAEAANGKLAGMFASQYRLYARLLDSLPSNRQEEARDAARMCLRLPLATIGMEIADFEDVARLGQMVEGDVSTEVALAKIQEMCTLMRQMEEKDPQKAEKSPMQLVAEEANQLLSDTILQQKSWGTVRPKLAQLFRSSGHDPLASFVELDRPQQ